MWHCLPRERPSCRLSAVLPSTDLTRAQVLHVVAGGMHTVALADDGTVWSWGVNDEGALGRQTAGEIWEKAPERVRWEPAISTSAGVASEEQEVVMSRALGPAKILQAGRVGSRLHSSCIALVWRVPPL